jgi:hypothetical protein
MNQRGASIIADVLGVTKTGALVSIICQDILLVVISCLQLYYYYYYYIMIDNKKEEKKKEIALCKMRIS